MGMVRVQAWQHLFSVGCAGGLRVGFQVPGATDFTMLSQTVNRHLSDKIEPRHAVENETFVKVSSSSCSRFRQLTGAPLAGAGEIHHS